MMNFVLLTPHATARPRALLITAIMSLLSMISGVPAQAQLQIDITRGRAEPLAIAIVPFVGEGADAESGRNIAGGSSAALEPSGRFRPSGLGM